MAGTQEQIGCSSFGKLLEWQGEEFAVHFKDSEAFSSFMTGGWTRRLELCFGMINPQLWLGEIGVGEGRAINEVVSPVGQAEHNEVRAGMGAGG